MQKSAGAYAASSLSDILAAGSDASNVTASIEASQKHFQSLVSQVATSAPPPAANDQDETADDASMARVQSAYADAAA